MKAPLLLLRWPTILAALGASIVVLVVATSIAPLFMSAAASGALREQLRDLPPTSAGFSLSQLTPLAPVRDSESEREGGAALFERRTRALERATYGLPYLGPSTATVTLGESELVSERDNVQVRPLAREGYLDNIEVVDQVAGDGVWLAERAAIQLGLTPGDTAELIVYGATEVRIKGIYRDLETQPVTDFWAPVDRFIHQVGGGDTPPPPLLMDVPALLAIGEETRSAGVESWEFPLEPAEMTLVDAHYVARRLRTVTTNALDPSASLGDLFAEPYSNTTLPVVVEATEETIAGIRSPVQVLALVGALVAAVLIAIAAYFVVQKRSIEFRLLVARGVGGGWITARAMLETIVPAIAFAALGALATIGLVAAFGPGPVDRDAIRSAVVLTCVAVALAVIAFGLATSVAAKRKTAVEQPVLGHNTGFPWEIVLLIAAGVTLYLIQNRGAVNEGEYGGSVDIALVIFPIFGVAGAALFILRMGFSSLERMRDATARSRTAVYLATRRLAGSSRSAMLFVGAAAVSVGMLVYSTSLVTSVRATTHAKTHVFVGSDVSVIVSNTDLPAIDVPHTVVSTIEGNVGVQAIDVMAVDPDTFAATAYWDEDFADRSLEDLIGDLGEASSSSLPIIAAGEESFSPGSFTIAGHEVPVEIVGRARTWPGMRQGRSMVVATSKAFERAASDAGFSAATAQTTLWAKGGTDIALAALQRAGIDTQTAVTARDAGQSSALLSISWTFGLLRVLGVVAGTLAIVGMLLYIAARQKSGLVSYLLGRRMGLTTAEHRSSVLLEVLAMFAAALVLGGSLGLLSAWLVYRGLDLLPTVPPSPLFRVPAGEVLATAIAFTLSAIIGARLIQRAGDRARPGEVMRLAD